MIDFIYEDPQPGNDTPHPIPPSPGPRPKVNMFVCQNDDQTQQRELPHVNPPRPVPPPR